MRTFKNSAYVVFPFPFANKLRERKTISSIWQDRPKVTLKYISMIMFVIL